MQNPFTIYEFMQALKPVKTCNFMDMCWAYYREAEQAFHADETHYEIRGLNTKSGHPHTIEF